MKNKFYRDLRRVSSLNKRANAVCKGGVRARLCFEMLFRKSSLRFPLLLARLRFGGAAVGANLWMIPYCEPDVFSLIGTQSSELKTVLCPYTSGDFGGNAVPVRGSQRDFQRDKLTDN